jgi:hypothetical protein
VSPPDLFADAFAAAPDALGLGGQAFPADALHFAPPAAPPLPGAVAVASAAFPMPPGWPWPLDLAPPPFAELPDVAGAAVRAEDGGAAAAVSAAPAADSTAASSRCAAGQQFAVPAGGSDAAGRAVGSENLPGSLAPPITEEEWYLMVMAQPSDPELLRSLASEGPRPVS